MDPRRARLATVKQDFARLALGLFAASPASPLTFSYAAMAEAPQGRADVLDVKGEGGFTLRYFVNNETRLPIMVTWTTPPTNVIVTVPGQPPPKTVAPGAVVVAGPAAPPWDQMWGDGTGSLEDSRGTSHVVVNGVTLSGNKTIFGTFNSAACGATTPRERSPPRHSRVGS